MTAPLAAMLYLVVYIAVSTCAQLSPTGPRQVLARKLGARAGMLQLLYSIFCRRSVSRRRLLSYLALPRHNQPRGSPGRSGVRS